MTDENGLLFGKISILDIIIVLTLVAASAAMYMRVNSPQRQTLSAAYTVPYEYTLSVENVSQEVAAALQKSVGTDATGKDGTDFGVIEKIESSVPSLCEMQNERGEVLTVQNPEKLDIKLHMRTKASRASAGILIGGKMIVSNGTEIAFDTKLVRAKGRINAIRLVR